MELIKKIKQAETQAQETIEQAKAEAAALAEQGLKHRQQLLEKAQQQRKETIEAAIAMAHSQGLSEIENLKTQAEKDRRKLRSKVTDKIAPAITKVMDYLRG